MYRQITFLIALGFAVGTTSARAGLVHHWKLNEDTAAGDTIAADSAGSLSGTIESAQSVPGKLGNALSFDGSDDVVTILDFVPPPQGTITFWIDPGFGSSKQRLFGAGGDYEVIVYSTGIVRNELFAGGSGTLQSNADSVEPGRWTHVAVTYAYDSTGPGTELQIYIDGNLDVVGTAGEPSVPSDTTLLLGHRAGAAGGEHYGGLLDDIRIYDHVLSEAEIKALAVPPRFKARNPSPPDGTLHDDIWVTLSFSPGDFAASHDVYLGDNFDDVNNGTAGTFRGNQTSISVVVGFPGYSYPEGLVSGTTYYWRIDEVNETELNSPWKGDVWSFSIPPKTAYNPNPADGAEFVDLNVALRWIAGFGAKLHYVYFGDDFDDVNTATTGAFSLGTASYTPGPLEQEKVYYWRVDEFDILDTYKGDVWSFTTPGAVGKPQPANGTTDVQMNAILHWTPADHAASHQVYFGTDKEATRRADTASPEYKGSEALSSESYDPGLLDWQTTYYWRVDEVNKLNPNSPWKGPLWSFTTANFIVVDDFEVYDELDNQIWYFWHDGLGYGKLGSEPYYPGNGTGSTVGELDPPYVEQYFPVHGGRQSMPYYYDNNKPDKFKYSEATLTLTYPRDWTEQGVGVLSLWFYGDPDNAPEPMYVAVANANGPAAVVYHDNPDAVTINTWTEWTIDLQAFAGQGVNLTDVETLSIGFGDKKNPQAGGSGKMYFDDIRLYPMELEPEP
jgi:hypothetical protein